MAWAIEKGVITGVTATTLAPQATATRAQAATILMRFAELWSLNTAKTKAGYALRILPFLSAPAFEEYREGRAADYHRGADDDNRRAQGGDGVEWL